MTSSQRGVGLNLRLEYIDKFVEQRPKLPFLEVIADNWLTPGPHHKKLELLRQDYEISFHCVGMNLGGKDVLNREYLSSIKALKQKFSPFQISDHVCFQKDGGTCFHDLLPIPFTEASLVNMTNRVLTAQDLLGEDLLLENLSYYAEFKSSAMSEVAFINALVKRSGARILLDLNNLSVNAKNLKHDANEFLNKIDWQKVGEIHLASTEKQSDLFIDSHCGPPDDGLLLLAKQWQEQIQYIPVLYERDKNLPEFNVLLTEVKNISRVLAYE